ncbi:MAG TPA: glycosyltransferase [Planctomycetota bacterium]|nr:glycosyltransferase [Planctomycetota bacterium]
MAPASSSGRPGYVAGIDFWPATTHAPGAGRYVRELVRAMVRLEERPELRLLDVGPGARVLGPGALGLDGARGVRRLELALPRRALAALSKVGLGAERLLGGCDLFQRVFPLDPPAGRARQVLAVLELPPEGSRQETPWRRALERADALVLSELAAREVRRRFGLEPDRVHLASPGCEHWARDLGPAVPRADPPQILALGRTDARRRHAELLGAFERLRRQGTHARLVFAGGRGDAAAGLDVAIATSPFARDVRRIERPREAELPALVARSAVLAHLSEGELSAVTPLEGLSLGLAVVASPLPAFVEALGEHAIWAGKPGDTPDVEDLALALERALASASDPAAQAARRAHASAFTWERSARLTLEAWGRILARA